MVINGTNYVQNFVAKTAGISVMQHRLKKWWQIPAVWLICFAVFFGKDVAGIDMERPFDLHNTLETFGSNGPARVAYPDMLPVLTSMLQVGLQALTQDRTEHDSPLTEEYRGTSITTARTNQSPKPQNRVHSMSTNIGLSQSGKLITRSKHMQTLTTSRFGPTSRRTSCQRD